LSRISQILDTLESFHGPQTAQWPTDPYGFLVWWHCGYPASEERCNRGWTSLNEEVGITPEKLLATPSSKLVRALKPGGMIPELRAGRLKEIARRVREEFAGDLRSALKRLPLNQARAALKKFPGIADPGADRIILFGGIATVPAVPSSCPQVLVRIESGQPHEKYNVNYGEAQQVIQSQVADTLAARTRAYLLVSRHGQQVCKRSAPKCGSCPVAGSCAFVAGTSGVISKPRARPSRAART
jgi:endonuclease III